MYMVVCVVYTYNLTFTQWNLRAKWPMKMEKKPPKWVTMPSRIALSNDQRVNSVR